MMTLLTDAMTAPCLQGVDRIIGARPAARSLFGRPSDGGTRRRGARVQCRAHERRDPVRADRLGHRRARRPRRGVRLRPVPRPAAGDRRPCRRRRRRARADADRRRQEPVLPGAGDRPPPRRRRRRDRRQPADRADAGPGRRARGSRRACRLPQLDARRRRRGADRARDDERPARAALRCARADRDAALARPARLAARARAAVAVRDRRGALRQPVGARLPRGLPALVGAARALSRRAAHRAHRDRRRADARRHRRAAGARRRTRLHQQLRPAEHPLRGGRRRTTRAASCSPSCATSTRATPASSTASRARRSTRRPPG